MSERAVGGNLDDSRSFATSFRGLISRARALRDREWHELSEVVGQSRERLCPLGEPLLEDIGLNRFLASAREETYSDWFQWLFAKMTVRELVCILGVRELLNPIPEISDEMVKPGREVVVERGHEGHAGRLDLLLLLGKSAIITLEVKLGSADSADTEKQKGYFESVESQFSHVKHKRYVLLTTNAHQEFYGGFETRTYASFCRNLRRLAVEWMNRKDGREVRQSLFAAALILTLTATIETNLLGLSVGKESFTPATMLYLKEFLAKIDNYE